MKITVFNLKGGQGKTAISLNLALSLDYGIITNDIYTPLENILKKEQFLKLNPNQAFPDLPKEYNIIFDFGGYADNRVIKALELSRYVLVPILGHSNIDLQVAINSIEEIKKYNQNIVLVLNKANKKDKRQGFFKKLYQDITIFQIKESRAINKVINEAQSIKTLYNQNKLNQYHYKELKNQFDKIINFITKD